MKIQVWATNKYGDGVVQDLGIYENIEDISINISMFSDDVIITFEEAIDMN